MWNSLETQDNFQKKTDNELKSNQKSEYLYVPVCEQWPTLCMLAVIIIIIIILDLMICRPAHSWWVFNKFVYRCLMCFIMSEPCSWWMWGCSSVGAPGKSGPRWLYTVTHTDSSHQTETGARSRLSCNQPTRRRGAELSNRELLLCCSVNCCVYCAFCFFSRGMGWK